MSTINQAKRKACAGFAGFVALVLLVSCSGATQKGLSKAPKEYHRVGEGDDFIIDGFIRGVAWDHIKEPNGGTKYYEMFSEFVQAEGGENEGYKRICQAYQINADLSKVDYLQARDRNDTNLSLIKKDETISVDGKIYRKYLFLQPIDLTEYIAVGRVLSEDPSRFVKIPGEDKKVALVTEVYFLEGNEYAEQKSKGVQDIVTGSASVNKIKHLPDGTIFQGQDEKFYEVHEIYRLRQVEPHYRNVATHGGVLNGNTEEKDGHIWPASVRPTYDPSAGWELIPQEWTPNGEVYETTTHVVAVPLTQSELAERQRRMDQAYIDELAAAALERAAAEIQGGRVLR